MRMPASQLSRRWWGTTRCFALHAGLGIVVQRNGGGHPRIRRPSHIAGRVRPDGYRARRHHQGRSAASFPRLVPGAAGSDREGRCYRGGSSDRGIAPAVALAIPVRSHRCRRRGACDAAGQVGRQSRHAGRG